MLTILKIFFKLIFHHGLHVAYKSAKMTFRERRRRAKGRIGQYSFSKSGSIRQDVNNKYQYDGDLLRIITGQRGMAVHKWHHYIPIYDRYFKNFRDRDIRFLEIGVSKGGSLQVWREYFGSSAIIYGIDIDPECEKYNGISAQVRIGSQADEGFLHRVIEEMGGIDIVLDDGSHRMDHLIQTLRCLFPMLNKHGLYMVEDLHTSYWSNFGGGLNEKQNFYNRIRDVVDDMHCWYHNGKQHEPMIGPICSAIHIHDSIVVLEKEDVYPPVHSLIC